MIIKEAIAMQKYQLESNNRVIVLCEKGATQRNVLKKLGADKSFEKYKDYFLFKHLEELELLEEEQFGEGWLNGIGEKVRLY